MVLLHDKNWPGLRALARRDRLRQEFRGLRDISLGSISCASYGDSPRAKGVEGWSRTY